jgi:hypothetical protein
MKVIVMHAGFREIRGLESNAHLSPSHLVPDDDLPGLRLEGRWPHRDPHDGLRIQGNPWLCLYVRHCARHGRRACALGCVPMARARGSV